MKWSFATVGIFILGLIGVVIIMLFQSLTTSSENDYYLLKEITESAMYDAVDITYYRETGNLKIVRERFVECFTRRYSESTLFIGGKYVVSFYDIMEMPPKVSLIINTGIVDYHLSDDDSADEFDVLNSLSGILEFVDYSASTNDGFYIDGSFDKKYYYLNHSDSGTINLENSLIYPEEVNQKIIKPGSMNMSINNIVVSNNMRDIILGRINQELEWKDHFIDDYYSTIDTEKYANICNIEINNLEIEYNGCNKNNVLFIIDVHFGFYEHNIEG